MKKLIKYLLLFLSILIFFCFSFINFYPEKISKTLINYNIEQNQNNLSLNKNEITVFTIGTGSPINAERVNSGTAIFVRDKFFIFDVGDGVVQQAR